MTDFGISTEWNLRAQALASSTFRLSLFRAGDGPGSALNRYGFLKADWDKRCFQESLPREPIALKTDKATFHAQQEKDIILKLCGRSGGTLLHGTVSAERAGAFVAEFDLSGEEQFFGLGDQTRERIEHRGTKADIDIANVVSYIPIPFIMSTKGYGILVNTTCRHAWDIGAGDGHKLRIYVPGRNLDLYFLCGDSLKDVLASYTELTGRPVLPPKWSFGLWFVCRTQASDFEVISDAVNFRERNIPCDVIGFEPGWMETDYDYSVEKRWSRERFPIPDHAPNGPSNLLNALKRMGYRPELWLCNDYDLSYEAERGIGSKAEPQGDQIQTFLNGDTEQDVRLAKPVRLDKYTKPDEPWFEHLKKFVDQGIDLFKQDGSLQVCAHPDRLWGNGMTDAEMHNLYPLLYSQQMFEGFKGHTGRRPCCFTCAGWAGLQRYTGTWTGDTGGGPKTLVACLNLALSGHSLVTCDMDVTTKEGIHYGFLMPWAHVNSWTYFRHPWLLGDDLYEVFCEYARLRSRLIPYLYTYAYVAHSTGLPMMRPMVLEFPQDPKAPHILTQWFLGHEFLVSSFTDEVYLPEGKWYDYWTGKAYVGPQVIQYQPPEHRGGGLFVRANSILPFGPRVQYVGQKTQEGMTLEIFVEPEAQADFTLYDDDGISLDYEQGEYELYEIKASFAGGKFAVDLAEGIAVDKIAGYVEREPQYVTVNGRQVDFEWASEDRKIEIFLRK